MVELSERDVVAVEVRTLDVRATLTELEGGGLLIEATPAGEATQLWTESESQGLVNRTRIQAVPA